MKNFDNSESIDHHHEDQVQKFNRFLMKITMVKITMIAFLMGSVLCFIANRRGQQLSPSISNHKDHHVFPIKHH